MRARMQIGIFASCCCTHGSVSSPPGPICILLFQIAKSYCNAWVPDLAQFISSESCASAAKEDNVERDRGDEVHWESIMQEELQLNCRFRRNFKPYPWVRIPTVTWQHTTPNLITLEYLPGMKISDVQALQASGAEHLQVMMSNFIWIWFNSLFSQQNDQGKYCSKLTILLPETLAISSPPNKLGISMLPTDTKCWDWGMNIVSGLDVKAIATRSTEAYIIQVLKHGFLHSDPHSGGTLTLPVQTTNRTDATGPDPCCFYNFFCICYRS